MGIILGDNQRVNEAESLTITGQLQDANGVNIAKASIITLTATLKTTTGVIINSRNAQSILDANNGTLGDTGLVTLILGVSDNIITSTGIVFGQSELNLLLLTWTYTGGSNNKIVKIYVKKVTV